MSRCDRCGKETSVWIMSYFNTDNLCPDCEKKEKAHPKFDDARRIETDHCKNGDFNFEGIGLPDDLKTGN